MPQLLDEPKIPKRTTQMTLTKDQLTALLDAILYLCRDIVDENHSDERAARAKIMAVNSMQGHLLFMTKSPCFCTVGNEAGDRAICNRCIALEEIEHDLHSIAADFMEDAL